MKTITIDNKHYIPAIVEMLPTNEESQVYLHTNKGLHLLAPIKHDIGVYNGSNQHLYLVCDLPIEEGDWIYHPNTGIVKVLEIEKLRDYSNYRFETSNERNWICDLTNDCKKVIATTDNSLKILIGCLESYNDNMDMPIPQYSNLPQFPQSFIKEFVKRQGKDVDVLVEVVETTIKDIDKSGIVFNYKIKLNPDNTVNIIFK